MTRSDYIKILDEQLQLLIEEQNKADTTRRAGYSGEICELAFRIMHSVPDSSQEEY